ncbi:MAG: hypothetical protein CMJ80_08340, partial [Planctomycetaceae bacterium]|nr:hypothetical protein [Planctomycetaceae bacterium]
SPLGLSINVKFATEVPFQGPAGLFGDVVWNQVSDNQGNQPLYGDFKNELIQTEAQVSWVSPSVQSAQNIIGGTPGDQALMGTYLESPSEIQIQGLDQTERHQDRLNYRIILYTYGGREGEAGEYFVNEQNPELSVDMGFFDGHFSEGPLGNMVVFERLMDPNLFIRTTGHAPINAMTIMYCLKGDFDCDGHVDVNDLETLNEAIKNEDEDIDLDFDLNLDLTVSHDDVMTWIKCAKGTCVGDVNLDGVFNSDDLVELFTEGLYNTDNEATWTSGDWNGDCRFDSDDLVLAFIEGCYETEAVFARSHASVTQANDFSGTHASQVPEPNTLTLFAFASAWLGLLKRRRGP